MLRRARVSLWIGRHLAQRDGGGAARRGPHRERQLRDVGRLRRAPPARAGPARRGSRRSDRPSRRRRFPRSDGRSACATWPTERPSEPARPRSRSTRFPASAHRVPRARRPPPPAPSSPPRPRARRAGSAPPRRGPATRTGFASSTGEARRMTETCTPPSRVELACAAARARSFCEMRRVAFGVSLTYICAWSTPGAPSAAGCRR